MLLHRYGVTLRQVQSNGVVASYNDVTFDVIDSYTKGLQQYFGKPSNSKPSLQTDIHDDIFVNNPGRIFVLNLNILKTKWEGAEDPTF